MFYAICTVKVKYEMHPLQHRRNLSIAFHQIHNFEYVCCMNIHTFSNLNVWVQCDVESTTIVLAQFVAKFRPNCEWKLMNRTTTNWKHATNTDSSTFYSTLPYIYLFILLFCYVLEWSGVVWPRPREKMKRNPLVSCVATYIIGGCFLQSHVIKQQ